MTTDPAATTFSNEYEQELESWLRRRFGFLGIVLLLLGAVFTTPSLVALIQAGTTGMPAESTRHAVVSLLGSLVFFFATKQVRELLAGSPLPSSVPEVRAFVRDLERTMRRGLAAPVATSKPEPA